MIDTSHSVVEGAVVESATEIPTTPDPVSTTTIAAAVDLVGSAEQQQVLKEKQTKLWSVAKALDDMRMTGGYSDPSLHLALRGVASAAKAPLEAWEQPTY